MLKFVFVKDIKPGDVIIRHAWKDENSPVACEAMLVKRSIKRHHKNSVVYDIEYITGQIDPSLDPEWTYEILSIDGSKTAADVTEAIEASLSKRVAETINDLFTRKKE